MTELSLLLLEASLATTGAALLVLALRLPLRRRFGARCAYGLWLLLPLALFAVLLPAPAAPALPEASAGALARSTIALPVTLDAAPADARPALLAAWLCGCLATAAVMVARQRRFRRRLGPLRARADGTYLAGGVDAGPAVVGLWRARIVLPSDFEVRFDPLEQALVLRHERVHIARGDLAANLAAAVAACLFWFNPVLRYALGRLRFDQELAADAVVLGQQPDARRPYADAMLKTQLPFLAPPLGCHWQSAHPLKERITMLKQPVSSPRRHAAGTLLVASLALIAAFAAWATQAPQTGDSVDEAASVAAQVRIYRGATLLTQGRFGAGENDEMQLSHEGVTLAFRFERIQTNAVTIAATLEHDGERVEPRLIAAPGTTASFAVDTDGAGPLRVEFDLASTMPAPRPLDEPEIGATYNSVKPPRYPKAAILARAEGEVLLRVLVTAGGLAEQVEVERSSGSDELDQAAIDAVRNWKFNAASNGHAPVPAWVNVPITFSLDGPPAEAAKPLPNTLDRIDISVR
jgi:bla regulator protein blaR1